MPLKPRFGALAGFRQLLLPERGAVPAPAQKPEIPVQQPRRNIAIDEGRFDEQRARAAQRIKKHRIFGRLRCPAGKLHNGCGKRFLEGGIAAMAAVAAHMQACPGQIKAQGSLLSLSKKPAAGYPGARC